MAGLNNQFPEDITRNYYSLWDDNISWLPDSDIPLKNIYCLPDINDQDGKPVDIDSVLNDIAISIRKITLIQGGAGIGKSAFVAYLSSTIRKFGDDLGIMVWTLPKSTSLIRIVMGECNLYSKNNNLERMILVFENKYGYQIDIDDVCKTIKQRQETWYPNISVILTCRESEVKGESADCRTLFIQPLSLNKICQIVQKYDCQSNVNEIIRSLYNVYGRDVIGNPVVLLLLLSALYKNRKISTDSDLYSLLLDNLNSDNSLVLLETIAYLTFLWQKDSVSIESLFRELQKDDESRLKYKSFIAISDEIENQLKGICRVSKKTISFEHIFYQDYYLASFLFNQINQMDGFHNERIDFLISILGSGILGSYVISLFESWLKNTENAQKEKIQIKWSQFFSAFLCDQYKSVYEINDSSFLKIFDQEMALFYNITAIYRCILKSNGSPQFLYNDNNAKRKLLEYLKLYSVSDYENSIDLSGMDFSEYDFSNYSLSKIDFSHCNLARCCFNNSRMTNVILEASDLRESNLRRSQWIQVDLSKANLIRVDLSDSIIHSSTFRASDLRESDLRRSQWIQVDLSEADLNGVVFSGSSVHTSTFRAAYLCCADLSRSTLRSVDCSCADLRGANLDAAICKQVDFSSANLEKSYLYSTVLDDISLEGANLSRAFLNLDGMISAET